MKRVRFSTRSLLLFIVLIAAATFVVRDYIQVRNAREKYRWVYAGWQSHRITIEQLTAASEELATQEADSAWISRRVAENGHIARIVDVWEGLDAHFMESSEQYLQNARDHLRKELDKHGR